MANAFREHIRGALANPGLQVALDANAERRVNARLNAITTFSGDWETARRGAHAIRAQTIAHLDYYLTQFIEKVQSNGVIVHRAVDAAQAVQYVLEIAREKHAKVVAKSKTMVSEEIDLNQALELAGLRVVETDLGEYIVQLRGERPGHIITPAVHLRRSDVGQTFHEKLGLPLTDDVPTLTAAARRILRQTFLDAEIGLSGVNFGVVETGTICIVSNEGNGRMVTTIPPVHIALMGIERLVPTMDDLAVMLALLPRAATGQKITSYTSLIHSPRQSDDPDGPGQRHLILVDNGREAMRHSSLVEALFCIRCGACLNACPIFREIGGHAYVNNRGGGSVYTGPIGSIVSPGLFGQSEFGHLARASSLCGACKEACPVDIDLPKLLLRVRAGGVQLETKQTGGKIPKPVGMGLNIYTWFAIDARRFHFAQRMVGVISRLLSPKQSWIRLPAFTGWGYSKDLPRPASRPFHEVWAAGQLEKGFVNLPQRTPNHKVDSVAPGSTSDDEPRSQPALIDRFAAELIALGGGFTRCNQENLITLILELLQQRGIAHLVAWDQRMLPPGLVEGLKADGIDISYEFNPDIRVGLTGTFAGVAETGTLVLPGGPGRPQYVSLLPEVHIALLSASRIYETLQPVFHLEEVRSAPTVALISGPSRTADIEMTLTIGVHGPREIQVFCVDDA